jgi:hypothetical protein
MSVQDEFNTIFEEWNKGEGYPVMYHLIIKWVSKYYNEIKDDYAKYDILHRTQHDLPDSIVEDFIRGDCYKRVRAEFGHEGQTATAKN